MSDFIIYDHIVEIGLTYYEVCYALSGKKRAYIFREHIRIYSSPVP